MKPISSESFVEAIASLLEEVHVGPPDPRATWITSNRPNSGFLGTLDAVAASVASQSPAPGMNTIAAHAAHLLFALSLALRAMHGELVAAIRRGPPLEDRDVFKGVISLVGHGAYHLGAMQTILRMVTKRG
jgi:hypothetical protein